MECKDRPPRSFLPGAQTCMAVLLLLLVYSISRQAAVLTSAASARAGRRPLVVIDSGHGGKDPGKVSVDGTLEKDINLQIALRLKTYLEASGVSVLLTRDEDEGLYSQQDSNKKMADMRARCQLINDAHPDLVVSIHQNSYPRESVCGSQVFYYQTSKEGKKLAEILQKRLSALRPDIPARQAKSNSSYYLLLHADPPAVIAECGFLSNWTEATLLASEEYQDQLAWALHMGILEYLNTRTPLNARAAAAGQGRCSTL